jgi:hypothetical protein
LWREFAPKFTVKLGRKFYCDISDGGATFLRAYQKLRAAGIDIFNPRLTVIDDPKVFREDREHIIGYLLVARDFVYLNNPAEDYHRPVIGPCQTGLKMEAEMELRERPRGVFVCAGSDEYIVHDDWLEHFGSAAIRGIKPVRYRGKVLPGWNRLRVEKREPVLDEFCFAWIPCAGCARPRVCDLFDLSFSVIEEPVKETVVNTRGEGHYGEEPCIIVSCEALRVFRRKVKSLGRAGLRPLAVYSRATKRYEILRKLHEPMAHLVDEALERLKTAQPSNWSIEGMEELMRFLEEYLGF